MSSDDAPAGEREPTGDPAVDAALDRLDERRHAPLPERLAAAEEAHDRLKDRLAEAGGR